MAEKLFDDEEKYTEPGLSLDREAGEALRSVFEKYVRAGFSVRDISHIVHGAVTDLELTILLDWNDIKKP